MEKTKNDKYLNLCNSADLEFSPLVMETFGGFGPAAIPILKRIGKALSNRTDQDESISMKNLCNQISFVKLISYIYKLLLSVRNPLGKLCDPVIQLI